MPVQPQKPEIKDLTVEQLAEWFQQHGMRKFRATQILKWIYLHQAENFQEMTNLSKDTRELLAEHFSISRLKIEKKEISRDGSQKYLFRLHDGNLIESVLIPEKNHDTLCISSQVGCAQGCRFCLTARGGFIRNLSAGEIISQVRDIKHATGSAGKLTNVVLMGMGEPLANYDNVIQALRVIIDGDSGLKISSRRVTLSTAGLVPNMAKLGQNLQVNLAVSLNATDNKTRDALMPINITYPIEKLLEACASFSLPNRRKITFEYILIKGINDTPEDAGRLADMLRPIRAKINLIPFNEHAESPFACPDEDVILRFQNILLDKGFTVIIRRSKGGDISAACGQLRANAQ
ncbi:MAG: 23S rRNA (adenine(2503)-C(2))-methyltransferase RlmN [Thermodesulfobacteriota bacterium]